MDQGIKMMILSQHPKSMTTLSLLEEEVFSHYFQETETNLKRKLIMLFNRFIKSITQASKSFQWKKKKNRLM